MSLKHGGKGPLFFSRKVILLLLLILLKIISTNGGQGNYYSFFFKGECDKQLEEQIERHPFSEPWEDSDLVLTVDDDTFYVHRQILSLHSPVFKAMLSSKFKEGTATEIPLPGKKANEVLDFLKVLYLKETEGTITCK